ncbi:hypothetical protein RI543_000032 [Arxiozyma heterogenica]|uniref:RRM domain-containing protein n=1 Tax=Arxiozyma heterogenica TaxID=278026 RepID=A0AAN7W6S3_9SACH|nr:hypothetical protein RI543_000032 [Kazachstania heterogenica]
MATDPRRRRSTHLLTPDNLTTCIQVTNIPNDWTSDTVTSVIAGSGRIIDITTKNDPRTGKLAYINYDYVSSRECQEAYDMLIKIEKFPCKLEKIIPPNYKERLDDMVKGVIKPSLELKRDAYPWSYSLELPFQMITAIPLPRKPNPQHNKDSNIVFPDILSKASQHLPAFKEYLLKAKDDDAISISLSKIPPLQLIEIISNLKILANQGNSKKDQLSQFLWNNNNLIIPIAQALLEMGFFTEDIVSNVLRNINFNNNNNSGNGSGNNTSNPSTISNTPLPIYNNMSNNQNNINNNNNKILMGATPSQMVVPGMVPPPVPFGFPGDMTSQSYMPAMNNNITIPIMNTNTIANNNNNNNNNSNNSNNNSAIPPLTTPIIIEQQEMIKQVLALTDDQLTQLPVDQQRMVHNLRKDYLV